MIIAALTPFENGFIYTASGHAGYAECGKDIMCAAVSMLTITIAERLKERDDIKTSTNIESGSAHIEAIGDVGEIYELLRCGLEFLKRMDLTENWFKIRIDDKAKKV